MSELNLDALESERPAPLWPNDGTEGFDFDEVERRLSGDSKAMSRDDLELAEAIARVVRWMHRDGRSRNLETIGMRALAVAWLLEPGLTGDKSLSSLAKRFKIQPRMLQKHALEASQAFNIRNRYQAHGWNRGADPAGN
jgi:hypothetical protein